MMTKIPMKKTYTSRHIYTATASFDMVYKLPYKGNIMKAGVQNFSTKFKY